MSASKPLASSLVNDSRRDPWNESSRRPDSPAESSHPRDIPPDRNLRHYTELEYILIGDLRDLLEEPIDAENARWLLAILDSLLETLPVEFELKESGGYLNGVLEVYPNWHSQVVNLQSEHEPLCRRLCELRERIAEQDEVEEIAVQLRHDLRDWMHSLIAHNRHESRLLQTAINLEVGCGD